jgi:hypothetical protein
MCVAIGHWQLTSPVCDWTDSNHVSFPCVNKNFCDAAVPDVRSAASRHWQGPIHLIYATGKIP